MEELNLSNIRHKITNDFARWCAFSSTRSGCPLKARADIYPLIDLPDYDEVMKGSEPITKAAFNEWHEKSVRKIADKRPEMNVGWSAKLVNVYLKTMVYVASIGRPGLENLIHPPIDGGLWEGIKEAYGCNVDIISKKHSVKKIKDIETYQQYEVIMNGIKLIADQEKCSLIEVEKYWKGTEPKSLHQ
jgi:hypothetical protein